MAENETIPEVMSESEFNRTASDIYAALIGNHEYNGTQFKVLAALAIDAAYILGNQLQEHHHGNGDNPYYLTERNENFWRTA